MNSSINNLKVYTDSGRTISLSKLEKKLLGYGTTAKIFKYRVSKVIKVLDEPGTEEQYDIAREIQGLSLPRFYHIEEVLANEPSGDKTYAGMITRYYRPGDIDIWTLPSSFLIKQIKQLRESAIILGRHKINIDDINTSNVLLVKDGIMVIDTDEYYRTECECDEDNLITIRSCVDLILLNNYFNRNRSENFSRFQLHEELLDIDPISDEFHKTLLKYKRPIDWLYRKK